MSGAIQSIPRTKHGESRIPNVEKYDVTDGYRLVVQLVDGTAKTRAFLFAGSHDDSDRWLDSHRNYHWVRSRTDGTLEFVQVTERVEERHVPADRIDLDSPEDLLALPLLRVLSPDEWSRLGLDEKAAGVIAGISANDYERDADGILARLDEIAGWEKASLVFDLLSHAHAREWSEVHRRVSVHDEKAAVVELPEAAPAMLAPENSESFVTFDDSDVFSNYFEKHSMADWMLFLHPEQKAITEKEYRGPARLRGISGSGKTSVLVHRARFLAKKYQQPIFLVTLTESMRRLLEHLVDDLCGVERPLIATITMNQLATQVVRDVQSKAFTLISPDRLDRLMEDVVRRIRAHPQFSKTPMHAMDSGTLEQFVRDEFSYVRGRLRSAQLDDYLDAASFPRRGRGLALNDVGRLVALDAIRYYEAQLAACSWLDHEGFVAEALNALDNPTQPFNSPRCVLCDEVQDLSQLEMALLGKLPTTTGEPLARAENGLFLSGDGAQSIFKKGFTLRRLGIDVTGRSLTLRKNYRNTHEILEAAFGLVSEYEFADVDEDNIAKPSAPDFAKRHGSRPLIVRYTTPAEEAKGVATTVKGLLGAGHTPGQIGIIAPSAKMRETVATELSLLGVEHTSLRIDAYYESDRVKISTIESAKGHEFGTVFIMGLVEGVFPYAGVSEDEIPREAARLYVAMTRARDSLTLTYSPWQGYPASRFLRAIQAHCDESRSQHGRLGGFGGADLATH
ncbi:MAG: 3'-5' exonuclease [Vicinamibacteria bacterium]